METMWKFVFEPENSNVLQIQVPIGSRARFVGLDPATGNPAVWVHIKQHDAAREEKAFFIYGTGHRINAFTDYVGSVIQGQFVWHIFEVLQ